MDDVPGRDEVIAMALAGVPPIQIANRTGLSINTVHADVGYGRRQGLPIPDFPRGRRRRVGLPIRLAPSLLAGLKPAAEWREIPVEKLVDQLLRRIVRDGLIDAVLDDRRSK